jgi:hypothetical protein
VPAVRPVGLADRLAFYHCLPSRCRAHYGGHHHRSRRRQMLEMIHNRPMILGFILGILDPKYHEAEAEKTDYFSRARASRPAASITETSPCGPPAATSPTANPVFLSETANASSLLPRLTFTHRDTRDKPACPHERPREMMENWCAARVISAPNTLRQRPPNSSERGPFSPNSFVMTAGAGVAVSSVISSFASRGIARYTAKSTRADRDFLRKRCVNFRLQSTIRPNQNGP